MEYTILAAPDNLELIEKVQQYISQGWRPLGGVGGAAYVVLYQAMIRE